MLAAYLPIRRWRIEESYKVMKSRIEMENFSGKSPKAAKQDFHARIFTANLTSILSFPVYEKIKKNHNKKTNMFIRLTGLKP